MPHEDDPPHGHRKGPPHGRKGPPHDHDHDHGHRKGPPHGRKGPTHHHEHDHHGHRKGPPKGPGRHVSSSAITRFIDVGRIDAILAPWVPDPEGRAFVLRCILAEGPAHHRGANYVLLSLLGRLVDAGGPPGPARGPSVPVPLRLPPHLEGALDDDAFPLALPTGPLDVLAAPGSPEQAAMIDCLTDGPPQHALANAAMVALLGVLLERAGG